MHTAHELRRPMISVELGGQPGALEDLLDWDVRDRLGVIMTSPFGALGAGLLVLLCVIAFYDVEKQKRRCRPLYPSIYLFHVGRPWGFHGESIFGRIAKRLSWPIRPRFCHRSTATVLRIWRYPPETRSRVFTDTRSRKRR